LAIKDRDRRVIVVQSHFFSRAQFSLFVVLVSMVSPGIGDSGSVPAQSNYTWKSVIAGGGGFVPGIIYHPTKPGLVYARTDMGGAYRWSDSAGAWIPLTDMLTRDSSDFMGILSIAPDPSNADRVYMECGKYTQSWAGTGAVLSSSDEGTTWTINPLPIKIGGNEDGRGAGERLQVDPNADSILYMGTTANGLWKSTDYASTWTRVSSFVPTNVNFVLFDKASGTQGNPTPRIFAAAVNTGGQSLYETTDGGNSWSAVSGQPSGVMAIRAALADSMLYVTFSNYQGPNGATTGSVWKYNVAGGTWTNISPASGSYGFSGISVYPKNSLIMVVSTLDKWSPMDEVYLTTDGGSTWQARLTNATLDHSYAPYTSTVHPHWLASVQMDPTDSSKAMFGTGFGIWACDNLFAATPTWYFKDENLEETVPMQIISPPFTNLLSAMGDYDGFRHDRLDASPQNRFTPNKGTTLSIAFAGKLPAKIVKAYNASPYGSYSTDGGASWRDFASVRGSMGYPAGTTAGGTWSIAISADGGTIVWGPTGAALSYSADNGKTWIACGGGVPLLSPVADMVNPNKFYAYQGALGQMWVSTDAGRSFTKGVGSLPGVSGSGVQDGNAAAVPGREGDLWICCGEGGLYRSTNSGISAAKISGPDAAYRIGFGKPAPSAEYPAVYLYGKVGGQIGIFRSDDSGQSWTRINDNRHQYGWIHQITGDPRVYGRCYISAEGRGIIYGDPSNSDTTANPSTFQFNRYTGDTLKHFYQHVTASWSSSVDYLGSAMEYLLHFSGPGVDTAMTCSDTSITFTVGNIQPSSTYILTGHVTNGWDTTAASNLLPLTTASTITGMRRDPETAPMVFEVTQNFPNPFNPSTVITYQIPVAGTVRLEVYNILGQEVCQRSIGRAQPGKYTEELDMGKYSSGVYFYRISATGNDGTTYSSTKKMLVMK
jgi:photosystem II stability/assembly factor-like uncharacterized protein